MRAWMDIQSMKQLAPCVIYHRRQAGLSQQLLADLSGVSRTAIQRIEAGEESVQMDTLLKVFRILNMNFILKGPYVHTETEGLIS